MITKEILSMFSKSARDNFRLEMPYNFYVEMGYDGKKRLGRLVNLSSKGACIEFIEGGELPPANSETTLQFLLPEQPEPFSLEARVVWTRKLTNDSNSRFVNLGVKFQNLNVNTYGCIWDFIIETISAPMS